MENSETGETPQKKRPHHLSSPLSSPTMMSPSSKPVDVSVLQYENQNLVQQSDMKKHELRDLEAKIQELKDNQTAFDDNLISYNLTWNQLVDDLVLLGVQAGKGEEALQLLDHGDSSGGSIPPCPAEDMFLCRLLGVDSIPRTRDDGIGTFVEEALASRHSSTLELMKSLEASMDSQRKETESIAQTVLGDPSSEDLLNQLSKIYETMKEEARNLHAVIDALNMRQKEYAEMVESYKSSHSSDQSEIKHLEGDLEETMAELEEARRKLVNLKMEKDAATGVHTPPANAINGNLSPEKPTDRYKGLRELRDSVEEVKILAADRLSELQEALEENQVLSKELENLQNEMKDDKHILTSRFYSLLNDQLQYWATEAERYSALTESLQADRAFVLRREKEINARLELVDAAKIAYENAGSRIEELEQQLQNLIIEKNNLEIEMEEAVQDSGREDIKQEFHVMATALSKEMGIMEAQVNRWKECAEQASSLREKNHSLKATLDEKLEEETVLKMKCAKQDEALKSIRAMIENVKRAKLEKQLILEMHMQEGHHNSLVRDLQEIKESECRAHQQAEILRRALDEHSLELRVKAANEAEAACQQRLASAEAEIADLRAQLDTSERDVLEVKEAIKSKDSEAEAYMSEIETIGQAYEDMQTQNQHLLQQLAERDDYNIKLVSESVKMKQAQNSLLSEKQALAKQLQQYNSSIETIKMRIFQSEEQMKARLAEGMKSTEEGAQLAIALEIAKWELMDAEKELKWLKHAATSSEKEDEQIQKKVDEASRELELERSERSKLEEELKESNDMVAKLTYETSEAAIQRLQDEIRDCKSILKCSVCFDRPKEVVIVKCYHLFCNPCIQRNLEIRHRKCPACGTAFGQNDVRFVKI